MKLSNSIATTSHAWLRNWFLYTNYCKKKCQIRTHPIPKGFNIRHQREPRECSEDALPVITPCKQLLIKCDASEHAAGYVLLTDDYTDSDVAPMKSYAPVAFGSQRFTKGQISLTVYATKFLAMHFAFDEFAHILWGVKKPTIVMTDNKALTRRFV